MMPVDDGATGLCDRAAAGAHSVSSRLVAWALCSGIVAWMVHLGGGSALVPVACERDLGWTIDVLTAATALVAGGGLLAARHLLGRAGHECDPVSQGYRIVGYVAMSANAISLALILAEGAMHVWIGACR